MKYRFVLVLVLVIVLSLVACVKPPMPTQTETPLATPIIVSPLLLPEAEGRLDKSEIQLVQEVEMNIVEMLAIAVFLSVVANRLIEALIVPIFTKFSLDKFWLLYVAWLVGGALVWLSGVNLFGEYLPNLLIGQVLTAVVSGGGANFLNDLFDRV